MSDVVGIFILQAKELKAVMVGGGADVRGEWWFVSCWSELCILCKTRMSSVRD